MKNEVIQASVYGTDQEVVKSWRPGIGRVSTSVKNTDRGGSQKAYLLMVNGRGLEFNGVRCLSKAGQRRISFHLSYIKESYLRIPTETHYHLFIPSAICSSFG